MSDAEKMLSDTKELFNLFDLDRNETISVDNLEQVRVKLFVVSFQQRSVADNPVFLLVSA